MADKDVVILIGMLCCIIWNEPTSSFSSMISMFLIIALFATYSSRERNESHQESTSQNFENPVLERDFREGALYDAGSIPDASKKELKIPALERDFREGALYDARTEQIVTGYSLWNPDDLKRIEIIRNDSTHYSINASDTLSEKFEGLDMSASVKLSILSGLLELGGSVAYLKKEKNTVGECSVQVRCFYKTGYKEMDMDQLTNIRYNEVARTGHNNAATHFVTKIQYGAGAIFTFTKQFQSSEEEEQVKAKAELQICGKTIKSVLDGSYERNHRNYSSSSQIKCEFKSFGLSLREALPTTYDEAVQFASNFGGMAHRSMARQGSEALGIPCIVWLYPLVLLPGCADAPKLYYDFTPDQAIQWIKFLEDCNKIENKLSDIIFSGIFPIHLCTSTMKCKEFLGYCRLTKESIQQLRYESTAELRELIVEIRSGLIPIDCFNDIFMSSLELRLGSVTQWMKEQDNKFQYKGNLFN